MSLVSPKSHPALRVPSPENLAFYDRFCLSMSARPVATAQFCFFRSRLNVWLISSWFLVSGTGYYRHGLYRHKNRNYFISLSLSNLV